ERPWRRHRRARSSHRRERDRRSSSLRAGTAGARARDRPRRRRAPCREELPAARRRLRRERRRSWHAAWRRVLLRTSWQDLLVDAALWSIEARRQGPIRAWKPGPLPWRQSVRRESSRRLAAPFPVRTSMAQYTKGFGAPFLRTRGLGHSSHEYDEFVHHRWYP